MKNHDRLEDFIRSNKAAFDDKEPPSGVWDNISRSMQFRENKGWWNSVVIWRAAAVVFMVLSGYLLIPKTSAVDKEATLAMKEFGDVEAFYVGQISQKVELIEELSNDESEETFTRDFQQLEAMYSVLKEEMKNHPSKKVKDALVLNLLVRINLLNQQLDKVEGEYNADEKDVKSENTSEI